MRRWIWNFNSMESSMESSGQGPWDQLPTGCAFTKKPEKSAVPPAVFHGADSLDPAEALGEIAQRGEAQNLGDEGEGVVCLPQEKAALFNTAGDQIADGRGAEFPAKGVGQVELVEMGQLGQLLQSQTLFEVVVNIPPDQITFPVRAGTRRFTGEGGVPLASQLNQHHFQQVLTDGLAAGQGLCRLLKHETQTERQLFPSGVEVQHGIALRSGKGFKSFYPQYRVFQRTFQLADLGMGNIGVDDHDIPDGYGSIPLSGEEAAVAAGDEKHLGAAMGVETGIPILTVLCVGDIEQPGCAA